MSISPKVLDALLDVHHGGRQLECLEHVCCVGEGLPVALANRFCKAPHLSARLHNCYGATETTTTVYTILLSGISPKGQQSRAPAGLPQPGARVWILDQHL